MRFVNSQILLGWFQGYEWQGGAKISLIRLDGEVLFEQEFREPKFLRQPQPSADGQRLAVPILRGHGGSAFLDIGRKFSLVSILVCDIGSRRWIYSLNAEKQGAKLLSGLGLSPDGSLLALITQDRVLEVFRVPDSAAHPP